MQGNVYCCPLVMQQMATSGPSWQDASSYCLDRGKRLCARSEYCPDGNGKAPMGGLVTQVSTAGGALRLVSGSNPQAMWAAAFDSYNEWISIGHMFAADQMCR